jgi:hypothetical protein
MTAAIRNNYSIVKVLYADGYRIFEKLADDRLIFSEGVGAIFENEIICQCL